MTKPDTGIATSPARPGVAVSIGRILRQREASVALMIIAVVIFLSFANEYFLTPRNILNVGRQASVVAIVALGQALVIIARGLDLSVGSVLGLSAVVSAFVAQATGNQVLALGAGLGTGIVVGLVNGLLFTRLNINPFIATLGTLSVARGLALLITGGIPIPYAGWAQWLGAGKIVEVPVSLILMLLLALAFHIFATHTRIGRNIYAIGDSPKAARLAGINVEGTRLLVFVLCGLLAGLGGIILAGNLASANPDLGRGYELDVIAAVILGGTALSGGRGTIYGVVLGALLMALLSNAFVLLGISAHWQVVTKGLVIILAVGIDGFRRGREE
ncbi:ribose/xylose/arabinose/galactoside ABC-type transport system permease subunit [Kaistia hirudinis]|uniref:Ribose/xylose/arabinose/galactoside ABC-type transport system permease subunit n=2 Tax=Kaistia hirudinis TaxID=1293440 RepID=A0A840AL30_9HYPH|nr:ABC transporter permease [Kaistia hirudinis]MBB3930302.1 ribose/xylose/arabinose/galactoside ABC-type transport system permease subunit [Kaistia hirudinis]